MKNIKQNELITIIQCSKLCGFNHKRLSKFRKRIPGFPCPKNESKRRNMPHLFDKKEFLKFQEKNNIHELV
ncbi:MAG: hypothetical protein KGI54_18090, partial [Pseudomonadota bacterium]|nr:hypothetical protein [Pseudomonadota bacterium]